VLPGSARPEGETEKGSVSTAADDKLLGPQDVAEVLGVTVRMVQLLAKDGRLQSRRVGRYLRFRRSWVDEYVDGGREA
jgi:excisionase family DNA binding protein